MSDRLSKADWNRLANTPLAGDTAPLTAASAVAWIVLRDVFGRDIEFLRCAFDALPPPTRYRATAAAARAVRGLQDGTVSVQALLADCSLSRSGISRLRAVSGRILMPALDDRVDAQGRWRSALAAWPRMLQRRWRTYG